MKALDLFVSPITFLIILMMAYVLKRSTSDHASGKYFYPALILKLLGAIGVGVVYQFYYGGGDTFTFFTHGATHIYDAFTTDFSTGIKLLFSNGQFDPETYKFSSKIWTYRDPSSFFIVRIAAILSLISLNTYSSIALWFAFLSFWGLWLMYQSFYRIYPELKLHFAIAIFFIPTVFFWGSGLLKDTITLGASGFLIYAFIQFAFEKRRILLNIGLFLFMSFIIASVKVYILLSLLPALVVWFFYYRINLFKKLYSKILIAPMLVIIGLISTYILINNITEDDKRYQLDNIAETAQITAYDIRYYTGKNAGSGYSLGELDGTYFSMIKLLPGAINVTLFRPYLWEVNNPLMLLSAIEALALFLFFLYILLYNRFKHIRKALKNPIVLFCMIFSLVFAFGVGVSTYNFGTLSRYRIVMIPFFLIGLFIIHFHAKTYRLKERSGDPTN